MAAQCRGATKLDRRHGAALRRWERSAALLSVGLAVTAEHVRHFDRTSPHRGPALRSVPAATASACPQLAAAANPTDSMSSRPCWWRSVGNGLSWIGCGARAVVGWYGHRCRTRAGAQRMRVEGNVVLLVW